MNTGHIRTVGSLCVTMMTGAWKRQSLCAINSGMLGLPDFLNCTKQHRFHIDSLNMVDLATVNQTFGACTALDMKQLLTIADRLMS